MSFPSQRHSYAIGITEKKRKGVVLILKTPKMAKDPLTERISELLTLLMVHLSINSVPAWSNGSVISRHKRPVNFSKSLGTVLKSLCNVVGA